MAHSINPLTIAGALTIGLELLANPGAGASGQRSYSDDPIATVVDSQDASRVEQRDIDLTYDTLENSFAWPGDRTPNVRALNINTVDEVPDSSWFTNRLGARTISVDELLKGPDTLDG